MFWRKRVVEKGSVVPTIKDWFVGYVKENHVTGCWEWTGRKNRGYGIVQYNKEEWFTHRLSYAITKGDIPDGYHIDHLCRFRPCCNPDHLEAVTPEENNRRMLEYNRFDKNRSSAAFRLQRCKNDHHLSKTATTKPISYVPGQRKLKGVVFCKECQKLGDNTKYFIS